MTLPPPEYVTGTKEYVHAEVTSSVDLTNQVVEIQLDGGAWLPATWVGAAGPVRQCRTTSIVDFTSWTVGAKSQLCRFVDGSETPILKTQGIVVVEQGA